MSFTRRRGNAPEEQSADTGAAPDQEQAGTPTRDRAGNMLPLRQGRRFAVERVLVRLVATGGIIGVGVLLGAILGSNKGEGWITGLVIAVVTVVLAALLWSSRTL